MNAEHQIEDFLALIERLKAHLKECVDKEEVTDLARVTTREIINEIASDYVDLEERHDIGHEFIKIFYTPNEFSEEKIEALSQRIQDKLKRDSNSSPAQHAEAAVAFGPAPC